MAIIKNKKILKCLLMMVVNLLLILNFLIEVSASTNYDRQDVDARITISERLSVKGGSGSNTPSANTTVISHGETKASQQIKTTDVTDYWDNYLGSDQTNINPRTGQVDADRIFSADGTRSIRFGNHEMNSMGTTKFHFHEETWIYDPIADEMHYYNKLIRIKE